MLQRNTGRRQIQWANGKIIKTIDGGNTWNAVYDSGFSTLWSLFFTSRALDLQQVTMERSFKQMITGRLGTV